MSKQRVELRVSEKYAELAEHHINWDAMLPEMLDYRGNGVWSSNVEYVVGYDDVALARFIAFLEERLQKYHIREYEIVKVTI